MNDKVPSWAESIHITVCQALFAYFTFDRYCSYDSVYDALAETFPTLSEQQVSDLMLSQQ